jgi:hypothetical protein
VDGQRINIRAVLVVGANRYSRNNVKFARGGGAVLMSSMDHGGGRRRAVGTGADLCDSCHRPLFSG